MELVQRHEVDDVGLGARRPPGRRRRRVVRRREVAEEEQVVAVDRGVRRPADAAVYRDDLFLLGDLAPPDDPPPPPPWRPTRAQPHIVDLVSLHEFHDQFGGIRR